MIGGYDEIKPKYFFLIESLGEQARDNVDQDIVKISKEQTGRSAKEWQQITRTGYDMVNEIVARERLHFEKLYDPIPKYNKDLMKEDVLEGCHDLVMWLKESTNTFIHWLRGTGEPPPNFHIDLSAMDHDIQTLSHYRDIEVMSDDLMYAIAHTYIISDFRLRQKYKWEEISAVADAEIQVVGRINLNTPKNEVFVTEWKRFADVLKAYRNIFRKLDIVPGRQLKPVVFNAPVHIDGEDLPQRNVKEDVDKREAHEYGIEERHDSERSDSEDDTSTSPSISESGIGNKYNRHPQRTQQRQGRKTKAERSEASKQNSGLGNRDGGRDGDRDGGRDGDSGEDIDEDRDGGRESSGNNKLPPTPFTNENGIDKKYSKPTQSQQQVEGQPNRGQSNRTYQRATGAHRITPESDEN